MFINDEITDMFLPWCHCEASEHWQVDPNGRIFCIKCKVYPTLQAVGTKEIESYRKNLMYGYFQLVRPQSFNDSILELKERYANNNSSEDRTALRDNGGFGDLFKPAQGNEPNQKRKSPPRKPKSSE